METRHGYCKRCYPYVTGISEERGGAGNPSPTAYGVYVGMKAAAKQQFGSDVLSGKKY
jgi:leucine dehydrogenase